CFITFTLFATLTYQLTISSFIKEEQQLLTRSMDSVEEVLEKADAPLNSSNLNTYIEATSKIQNGEYEGMSLGSIIGTRK
ncbi:hypothetical protein, partial [Salmonella enterica]